MTSPLLIRPIEQTDFQAWTPLWDGYNAFYGRSGPTALPEAITATSAVHIEMRMSRSRLGSWTTTASSVGSPRR